VSINSDEEYIVPGLSLSIPFLFSIGPAVDVKFGTLNSQHVRTVTLSLDFCGQGDGNQLCGSDLINAHSSILSALKDYCPFPVFSGDIDLSAVCKSSGGVSLVVIAVVVVLVLGVAGGVAWYLLVFRKRKAAAATQLDMPLMVDEEVPTGTQEYVSLPATGGIQ